MQIIFRLLCFVYTATYCRIYVKNINLICFIFSVIFECTVDKETNHWAQAPFESPLPSKQTKLHSQRMCEKKELSSLCVFRQKSLERRAKNSWVSHWYIRDKKGCKFEKWILLFLKWCWALRRSGWRCFKRTDTQNDNCYLWQQCWSKDSVKCFRFASQPFNLCSIIIYFPDQFYIYWTSTKLPKMWGWASPPMKGTIESIVPGPWQNWALSIH